MSYIAGVFPANSNEFSMAPFDRNSHGHDKVDHNTAQDDPEAANEVEKPAELRAEVIMVSFLFLALTLCLGLVGAVKLHNGDGIVVVGDIFQDPTFCIICSQVTLNVVHGIFEWIKVHDKQGVPWKSPWLLYCVNSLVIILSLTSPLYYGVANRRKTWTQVVAVIFSLTTALFIIFSDLLSVSEAKRLEGLNQKASKAANDLVTEKAKTAFLEAEIEKAKMKETDWEQRVTDLEKDARVLREKAILLEENMAVVEEQLKEAEMSKETIEKMVTDISRPHSGESREKLVPGTADSGHGDRGRQSAC